MLAMEALTQPIHTDDDDDDYIEDYGSSLTTCPPFWHLAHSFLPQTRPETKLPHSLIKICKAEDDRDYHDEDEGGIVNEHEGGFLVMIRVSHFSIEAFLEELERRNSCVHTRMVGTLWLIFFARASRFIGFHFYWRILNSKYLRRVCGLSLPDGSFKNLTIDTRNNDTVNWNSDKDAFVLV